MSRNLVAGGSFAAFAAAAALLVVPAAAKKVPKPDVDVPFSINEVAWSRIPGTSSVQGSAVLRTVGGEAKTCAALKVELIPYSEYGSARLKASFGNDEAGYLSVYAKKKLRDAVPEYYTISKETACDGQGHFTFRNLAAGTYYIMAPVYWGVPGRYATYTEGGTLMRKVVVAPGETADVVLSQ